MISEPIDQGWIKNHAGSILLMHLNMGDVHQLVRKVVDRRTGAAIGLTFRDVSYKRSKRNGAKGGTSERVWFVEGHEGEIASLDEALDILRIQQLGEAA